MRLHTNGIQSQSAIHEATTGLFAVYASVSEHASRTHARAFEISLEGNGYRRNRGTSGDFGATWDEWGVVIGRLYVADPLAVWGTPKHPIYASADSFHWATGNRFVATWAGEHGQPREYGVVRLPADTCKRHKWNVQGVCVTGTYRVTNCTRCSAITRSMMYGHSFDEISGV